LESGKTEKIGKHTGTLCYDMVWCDGTWNWRFGEWFGFMQKKLQEKVKEA